MMGHLVKVLPGRTFRLHLAVCPPYNADFDGDEMNLHVPQTEEARAEARTLMLVEKHIITPRYGGAIIGARQDYIIGAYLLSHKSTFLTKKEVAFLLGAGKSAEDPPEPAILHPVELWTGKQIIPPLPPEGPPTGCSQRPLRASAKTRIGVLATSGLSSSTVIW